MEPMAAVAGLQLNVLAHKVPRRLQSSTCTTLGHSTSHQTLCSSLHAPSALPCGARTRTPTHAQSRGAHGDDSPLWRSPEPAPPSHFTSRAGRMPAAAGSTAAIGLRLSPLLVQQIGALCVFNRYHGHVEVTASPSPPNHPDLPL